MPSFPNFRRDSLSFDAIPIVLPARKDFSPSNKIYYALNSHLGGSGRDMEQAGKDGNACGVCGDACGMCGDARGLCGNAREMDGNARGLGGNVRETGRNVCGRSESQGGERMVRTRQRRESWMRRERMRRMLDGCGNTFKDVFDRIDAMLDVATSP